MDEASSKQVLRIRTTEERNACPAPLYRLQDASPFLVIDGYDQARNFLGSGYLIPFDFSLSRTPVDAGSAEQTACKELEEHRTDRGPFDCEFAEAWKLAEDDGWNIVFPRGWRILGLGEGRFAVFNEAPVRTRIHPYPEFYLYRRGRYVISETVFPRWECPTARADGCVRWHPKRETKHFYCAADADRRCLRAGIESHVTLLDSETELVTELGPFTQAARPVIEESNDVLTVHSEQCGKVLVDVAGQGAVDATGR